MIKKRWGYLRDYFLRQYRDVTGGTSGQGAPKKPRWALFDMLTFLKPHVQQREISGNLRRHETSVSVASPCAGPSCAHEEPHDDESSDETSKPNNARALQQETLCTTQEKTNPLLHEHRSRGHTRPSGGSQYPRTGKRVGGDLSPFEVEVFAALQDTDSLDDDDHFFRSLKPMLKQLDTVKKLQFRSEVQNLLVRLLPQHSPTRQVNTPVPSGPIHVPEYAGPGTTQPSHTDSEYALESL